MKMHRVSALIVITVLSLTGCSSKYHKMLLEKYYSDIHPYNVEYPLVTYDESKELLEIEDEQLFLEALKDLIDIKQKSQIVNNSSEIKKYVYIDILDLTISGKKIDLKKDRELLKTFIQMKTVANSYCSLDNLSSFDIGDYRYLEVILSEIKENRDFLGDATIKQYFNSLPTPSKLLLAKYIEAKEIVKLPLIDSRHFYYTIEIIDRANYRELLSKTNIPPGVIDDETYISFYKNYYDFEELINSMGRDNRTLYQNLLKDTGRLSYMSDDKFLEWLRSEYRMVNAEYYQKLVDDMPLEEIYHSSDYSKVLLKTIPDGRGSLYYIVDLRINNNRIFYNGRYSPQYTIDLSNEFSMQVNIWDDDVRKYYDWGEFKLEVEYENGERGVETFARYIGYDNRFTLELDKLLNPTYKRNNPSYEDELVKKILNAELRFVFFKDGDDSDVNMVD